MSFALNLAERGWLPDSMIRFGIRQMLRQRLNDEGRGKDSVQAQRRNRMLDTLRNSPVAIETTAANEQHYELPPAFFAAVLGPRLKYSSCLWQDGCNGLREAEDAMLELYCQRAQLKDGQDVLELGCGWGSLTLWMARRYPNSQICAISNSPPQKRFIEQQAVSEGLLNLSVLTADVNDFEPGKSFDRIVSVEMFEHLRNYATVLERISNWLHADGLLFVHIFCHQELLYPFETKGDGNWMGRYFFTGGLMPSFDTLAAFPENMQIAQSWKVSGLHYQKTANAWLENLDLREDHIEAVLKPVYGDSTEIWLQRWRMFFMACAELFGYQQGDEWLVGHYLMRPAA